MANGRQVPLRDLEATQEYIIRKLPLYDRVALRRDINQHGLRTGDVAMLVDYVPRPSGGPEGCVLEVFNAVGESIAVVTVEASDIGPLRADEVLAVRHLAQAG